MFSDGLNTNELPAVEKSDSACNRFCLQMGDVYRPFTEFLIPNLLLNVIPAQAGKSVPRVFGNIVD